MSPRSSPAVNTHVTVRPERTLPNDVVAWLVRQAAWEDRLAVLRAGHAGRDDDVAATA